MENDERRNIHGIKIKTFNACMIAAACVLYALLLYATATMTTRYNEFIKHNEDYIACSEDAMKLSAASDYLTDQVRLFTQNMDTKHMSLYFQEANDTRRREKAIEELKKHQPNQDELESLEAARAASLDLMNREFYAMKLVCEANAYEEKLIPQEVRSVQLTANDRALSNEAKVEKARSMVYDRGYMDAKALIKSHTDHFVNSLMHHTSQRQKDSMDNLDSSIFWQRILISLLFIMNIITFGVITILIVKPLNVYMKCLRDKMRLETQGAYEFKYFAMTYNDIYELNEANEAMLVHRATHDPLTGIMNRSAFDHLRELLKKSSTPLALLLIDVDKFKTINDTYGHEVGDKVLKKVGQLLNSFFRSDDYPIRIGGDEFAIIMNDINADSRKAIHHKISLINKEMQDTTEGLPSVTLSVGVAFSAKGYSDSLYKQADKALYAVKEHGRSGLQFYDELF